MGAERIVHFQAGTTPDWPDIAAKLVASGESPILRMIDGLPAFPDEVPNPYWKELRIGLAGGMVTLQRGIDSIRCVIWGGNDAALKASLDTAVHAVDTAGQDMLDRPT